MAAIRRRSPASGKDARIMTSRSRTVNGLRGERVVLADPISSRTWEAFCSAVRTMAAWEL